MYVKYVSINTLAWYLEQILKYEVFKPQTFAVYGKVSRENLVYKIFEQSLLSLEVIARKSHASVLV